MARSRTYDFYSPFLSASIVQNPDAPNATRFPLWVEGVSPDQARSIVPLNPDGSVASSGDVDALKSLAFVSELTIELQLAFIPRITAVLTPPFRDAKAFLNSSLIEWGNSTLEVQFGYTGGAPEDVVLSSVFSGVLLQPEVTIGNDISITLNAQGVGAFTGIRQDSTHTYQNVSRRTIIETLAKEIGLEPNFDEVDAVTTPERNRRAAELIDTLENVKGFRLSTATIKALDDSRRVSSAPIDQPVTVSVGGLTKWRMIYQLVRESQCWMFVQGPESPGNPEQLRVVPRNSIMNGVPQYTFTMFDHYQGQFGPSDNTFPIQSVSSPTKAVYLPSKTRGFLVYGYDSKERAKAIQQAPNQGFDRTGEGQTQANITPRNPKLDPTKGEGAGVVSSDSLAPEFNEQVRAEQETAATNMGVQLQIGTLGIPDILPAQVAAVRGVGSRLDGNYAIFKVTHKFGLSGASTDLELRSNVGQLAGTFDRETVSKDPANDKNPPSAQDTPGNQKKAKAAS